MAVQSGAYFCVLGCHISKLLKHAVSAADYPTLEFDFQDALMQTELLHSGSGRELLQTTGGHPLHMLQP